MRSFRLATTVFGAEAAEALKLGRASSTARNPIAVDAGARYPDLDGHVLVVPLFRDGRWHALMFAARPGTRDWTEQETELLREVMGRTWDAMERARAVVTLRRAQGRPARA